MIKIKKYAFLLSILLLSILFNIILLFTPVDISGEKSLIELIPWYYWLLMLIEFLILFMVGIKSNSKIMALISSVLFFVTFYSFSLFFKIISVQTDLGSISVYMNIFDNYNSINTDLVTYFEYPIFFSYGFILKKLFMMDGLNTTNVGFFSLLIIIPLIFPLIYHNNIKNKPISFFIIPIYFLLLTFYFLNDQFVPQFMGLILLLILSGLYIRFKENNNKIFLILLYFFYFLTIFTHPFMFVFFLIAIIIIRIKNIFLENKYFILIIKYLKNYDSLILLLKDKKANLLFIKEISYNWLKERIIPIFKLRKLSLTVLIIIYLYAYNFHLLSMKEEFIRFLESFGDRGGSWLIIGFFSGSQESIGLIDYHTYPLYNIVNKDMYFLSRYLVLSILLIYVTFLIYSIFITKRRNLLLFDVIFSIGSILYFLLGFLYPHLLGQRAFQAMFMNSSKYSTNIFNKKNIFSSMLATLIIISPLIFIYNIQINYSIEGYKFQEDISTISVNSIIDEYSNNNTYILYPDRNYNIYYNNYGYYLQENNSIRINPESIVEEDNYNQKIDTMIYSSKLDNRLKYFGLKNDIDNSNQSIVYDQGKSKILSMDVRDNRPFSK